ncbi:RNA dependent RNA polymerase-domain-containing protein [Aspergillus similis]
MEVFVHNLPGDLNKDALKNQLEPFMRSLAITDYDCEKPRKKRFGHILFLNRSDGERFLARHGEERRAGLSRPISRLNLLGSQVLCKPSHRNPDEFDLRALANEVQERTNPSRIIEEEGDSVSFMLSTAICGYTVFVDNEFAYVPELDFQQYGTVIFKKRNIIVHLGNTRRIKIPLSTIYELVWSKHGSMLLTLVTVPLFFECVGESRIRLPSLGGYHADIVGQCLVYEFEVVSTLPDLKARMRKLAQYDLTIINYGYKRVHDFDSWHSQLTLLRGRLGEYTRAGTLPFGILFQLQALVYNGYLPPNTVLSLTRRLAGLFKTRKMQGRRPISVNSMKRLFNLIDWPSPFGDPEEFSMKGLLELITGKDQDLPDGIIQKEGLFRPAPHLTHIHRVVVSPSRITLHGPETEPLNRILRRFPNHHEYFIRVQFCDENGQDIYFNPRINNDQIFVRFKNVFENGFQIAGRTYTFLGFSHSSLRSRSAWFSAPFVDDNGGLQSYFTIIKAIGRFSEITSPARCAARIGQAFSDTPFAVNLKKNGIRVLPIPDVQVGGRVFSDGVGTISTKAVDAIHGVLPPRKGMPTCFQIRLGGAKGMLSLDPRLRGSKICIRPSMTKFQTDDHVNVEICGSGSKPISLFLNRQVIKILEDMGVDGEWFMKLQELRIEQLRKATATTKNTANFIKGQSVADCVKIYRLFWLFHNLKLDYKEIPFLRAVVEAMVLRELRLLKHKARIPVHKGITLYGIMDETGFLNENEVFVTYQTVDRLAAPPRNCRLLVTRSPALHDGDIQYAYNVIPPKGHPLRQHQDCIVFSQKGARDLPSQLSGGDLDGDLYNIIWDPDAAPKRVFAPANYPRNPPLDIRRVVERKDMADFFVDFMQSDRLGVIATKHMILADQMELGTSHSDCKKLAQLHSTAVDFSKTGVPVRLEEMPFVNRNRPDFLAPGPLAKIYDRQNIQLEARYVHPYPDDDIDFSPVHKYYRSEKILGKLYRAIDEHEIWRKEIHTTIKSNPTAVWKRIIDSLTGRCIALGAPVNWKAHVETARQLRSLYEDAMSDAMANFSEHPIHPITELEVFIGQILNNSGVQTHRQRERSIKLKGEFERIASLILSQMRPPGPITGYASEYDSLERCLACFHVAGETEKGFGHRRRGWHRLESFRVVSACALLMEVEELERNRRLYGENVRSPLGEFTSSGKEKTEYELKVLDRAKQNTPFEDSERWTLADIEAMLHQLRVNSIP